MISLQPSQFSDSRSIQSFVLEPTENLFDDYALTRLCDGSVLPISAVKRVLARWLLTMSSHEFRFDGPNANYKAHCEKKNPQLFDFLGRSLRLARPGQEFISIGQFVQMADLHRIEHLATPDKKAKTVCCSWTKAKQGRGELLGFYNEWFRNVKDRMIENGDFRPEDNLHRDVLPLLPYHWLNVSTEDFLKHLANTTLHRFKGNRVKAAFPEMIEAYWGLVAAKNGLAPSQEDFVGLVESRHKPTPAERQNFLYRVGYLAYPAFVRQHHFGLMLRDVFGAENVLGGPLADEHYKTDWVVIDEADRPHAVHLTTFGNPTTHRSLLNVYANHEFRHQLRGEVVGKGDGFFLHDEEEVLRLKNCEKFQVGAMSGR